MSGLGPFTKVFLLAVLAMGCAIMFIAPYVIIWKIWKDIKRGNTSGESTMALIVVSGWALGQTAMALDWIYWGILWMVG